MKILFIVLTLIFAVHPLSAKIYKYKDQNGVTIFTDNLSEVPVDQRKGVESFNEIKTPESEIVKEKEDISDQDIGEGAQNSTSSNPDQNTENLSERQILSKEQNILNKEYENLVRKKQALKKEKPASPNAEELADYREKVISLNKEIKEFDVKRKAFESKLDAYNSKIRQ